MCVVLAALMPWPDAVDPARAARVSAVVDAELENQSPGRWFCASRVVSLVEDGPVARAGLRAACGQYGPGAQSRSSEVYVVDLCDGAVVSVRSGPPGWEDREFGAMAAARLRAVSVDALWAVNESEARAAGLAVA